MGGQDKKLPLQKKIGFFTAAGGVYHSLVRRLWCRWFILNKLLSQKKVYAGVCRGTYVCVSVCVCVGVLGGASALPIRSSDGLPAFTRSSTLLLR